jgi:hypothetical protein
LEGEMGLKMIGCNYWPQAAAQAVADPPIA